MICIDLSLAKGRVSKSVNFTYRAPKPIVTCVYRPDFKLPNLAFNFKSFFQFILVIRTDFGFQVRLVALKFSRPRHKETHCHVTVFSLWTVLFLCFTVEAVRLRNLFRPTCCHFTVEVDDLFIQAKELDIGEFKSYRPVVCREIVTVDSSRATVN